MKRPIAWLNLHATNALRWLGLLPPLEEEYPEHVGWDSAEEIHEQLSAPCGPKRGGAYGELAAHADDTTGGES